MLFFTPGKLVVQSFLLSFILLSTPGWTATVRGTNLYLEQSDDDYAMIASLLNPDSLDLLKYPVFSNLANLLILGDGFSKKWNKRAEVLKTLLPSHVAIFKTDIECPESLDGNADENLHFRKIDHNQLFPFASGTFDLILMPYGLCICQCTTTTCGGINVGLGYLGPVRSLAMGPGLPTKEDSKRESNEKLFQFLFEVARVLNPKNPHAFAFLHGPANSGKYPELAPYENMRDSSISKAIPKVEKLYPQLDFKVVYFRVESAFQFQGIRIRNKNERK